MARISSESSAAIPGVRSLPVVSSQADSAASQPQYMKIDSDNAAASAENDSTLNGFSQAHSKSVAVGTSPLTALPMATTANSASAAICTATSTYITPLVAVMPR